MLISTGGFIFRGAVGELIGELETDSGLLGIVDGLVDADPIPSTGIAGVDCEVVCSDGLFSQQEFAFDPIAGVLFRAGSRTSGEGEEMGCSYTVTEYSDSSAALGDWPG